MKSFWRPTIGLEVHVELNTKAKMFCHCRSKHFGQKPNTHTCPVCLGLPGALPVPNLKAIEKTLLIALAFDSQINNHFWFDRKNYFYPDLPKGYQISQHFKPIGIGGAVPILAKEKIKRIALDNIHLEEDTGKLIHQNQETLIDFNRSGVPLVEIVSQPVLTSALEAKLYLQRLQQTLRWLDVSDCDMEKGSMRLEVNISVSKTKELPDYKVEIKNLNSFKFVQKAINYEINRQINLLEKGKKPKQETRGFNLKKGITYSQRSKEVAKDYRYFPEPDIPPFSFQDQEIDKIKKGISGLPWDQEVYLFKLGLDPNSIALLTKKKKLINLFKSALILGKKNKVSAQVIAKCLVNNPSLRKESALSLIKKIIEDQSKFTLSKKEIKNLVKQTLKENPKAVGDYQKGKAQVIGFLIGQVRIKAKGKADPKLISKAIEEKLKK
ncbi:MAG: Asp-tRNA(Asn)/Glu-tRNA(Gln) amidotransferase subunit GatB [Candidatus Shapirobacteria bacterium]